MSLRLVSGLMSGQSVIDNFNKRGARWGLSACAGGAAAAASLKVLSVLGIYSGSAGPYLINAGTAVAILGAVVLAYSLLPQASSLRRSLPPESTLGDGTSASTNGLDLSEHAATNVTKEIDPAQSDGATLVRSTAETKLHS